MEFDQFGRELPDDTPVEVPLRFRAPPTLQEQIKAMVRNELSRAAAMMGEESFEEADDFVTGDEDEPFSPYELTLMQEEVSMPVRSNSGAKESEDGSSGRKGDVDKGRTEVDRAGVGHSGGKSGASKQSVDGGSGGGSGKAARGGNESGDS